MSDGFVIGMLLWVMLFIITFAYCAWESRNMAYQEWASELFWKIDDFRSDFDGDAR